MLIILVKKLKLFKLGVVGFLVGVLLVLLFLVSVVFYIVKLGDILLVIVKNYKIMV